MGLTLIVKKIQIILKTNLRTSQFQKKLNFEVIQVYLSKKHLNGGRIIRMNERKDDFFRIIVNLLYLFLRRRFFKSLVFTWWYSVSRDVPWLFCALCRGRYSRKTAAALFCSKNRRCYRLSDLWSDLGGKLGLSFNLSLWKTNLWFLSTYIDRYILGQQISILFNSNAGGCSLFKPVGVKALLCGTEPLNRLDIFSLLSSISFQHLFFISKLI